MSRIDPREIRTASLSDVGRIRSDNQDRCAEFTNEMGFRLLVVADGMGGHQGGGTASCLAIDALRAQFEQGVDDPRNFLDDAFQLANHDILRTASSDRQLAGMGTTAVAFLFTPDGSAWVAHVGDSRAYRLRRGRFEAVTLDHSWVAEQVQQRRLTSAQAEVHPGRNVLSRSIGIETQVDVDIAKVDVKPGDRLLLCSDGLWGEVDDGRIAQILGQQDPDRAVRALVDLANQNGGRDNVTVQVAVIPGAPPGILRGAARLLSDSAMDGSHRTRTRRVAAAAVIVCGLLVIGLVWLMLGGTHADSENVAAPPLQLSDPAELMDDPASEDPARHGPGAAGP